VSNLTIYSPPPPPALQPESRVISLSRDAAIDDGIGLDVCWRVLRRHSRMIAGVVLLAVCVVGTAVFLMTPSYSAKSTLLIEPEQPQLLDVKGLLDASEGSEEHDYYKTQFELLQSRDLADRVINELDLEHNKAFNSIGLRERVTSFLLSPFASLLNGKPQPASTREAETLDRYDIISHYLSGLTVKPVAGTRLVTVSYATSDRQLAARIVDRHVHDYVQMGIDLRAQAGKSARDFLASQLAEIGHSVQESEAKLNAYRHQMGILSFGVDEKNTVAAQRMNDLSKALTEVETRRMAAEAQLKLVEAGDFDSLPQVINNPAIVSLTPQVRTLQEEYARLSMAFKLGYPKLDEVGAQMDAAQRALTAQIRNVAKSVRRNYVAADAEEKRLQSAINAEKAKDLAINNASLRDAVLVRDVEANRQLYQNVLKRMQEMQVTEQAPISNISIVDNAVVSRFPSEPKKLRDICIAGLLASLLGIGAAFYADQNDDRLRTLEETEEFLGLPSLAMVPDFSRLGSRYSSRKPLSGTAGLLLQTNGNKRDPRRNATDPAPKGYIAGTGETYRMIRTALLFSRPGSPPQTILVSSAIKGEGKTCTAANTALVFAHTGVQTLLIDADLRRPSCHFVMEETNQVGLSDVLAGQLGLKDAIRRTNIENLFLLTAGSAVPNPAELLTSAKMREIITVLRQSFGIIMIDTAPLMLASDTCALATMVDGVVLVAGAQTPKARVQRACGRLKYVGANVLGVVLNRVNIHEPDYDEFRSYYVAYGDYETRSDH
jgi:polysaccharide biosynthesis transport protein